MSEFEENRDMFDEEDWGDEEERDEESDWDSNEEESDWDSQEDSEESDWGYSDEEDENSSSEDSNSDDNSSSNENTNWVSDDDYGDRESDDLTGSIDVDKSNFKLKMGTVNISDIVIPNPIKESRKETYLGLTRSVEELGVLVPIHIMVSEGFAEYVEETGSEDGYEGPKYILLDGLRRIFALKKNGLDRVNAVIYDFEDKDKGSDMVNILSMILNKVQKKSWSEIWYLHQVLESQSSLSPGNIEYLLQLEPGDSMKLKEIMTRKKDFPEPAEDLLDKKKSLQQAYNMLVKAMKDQDQLAKEDVSGVGDIDETDGIINTDDGDSSDGKLSNEEVKEILDMEDKFDGELSEDDFDELMGNNLPDERQTVGERHPLDPALRAAVLQRDGYCCQITGRGKGLPTPIALSILNIHHKIPVHCGGDDSMDNLITVCLDSHTLIHIIERNMGKLGMSKEQFDKLDEEEKNFITGVMKIARIAVEANKRMGKSRDKIRNDTADSIKFKMPGVVQKENMEAVANAGKLENS